MTATVRRARVSDGQAIHELVNVYAKQGLMLPRSRSAVYQAIRDFMVADEDGKVLGCGALHVAWGELGEIRSLAVADGWQGRGIGRQIVEALLEDGLVLGVNRVFALTYNRPFFARLGFHHVDKETLPHKVWADCVDCIKFPNCDEEAVIIQLERL